VVSFILSCNLMLAEQKPYMTKRYKRIEIKLFILANPNLAWMKLSFCLYFKRQPMSIIEMKGYER